MSISIDKIRKIASLARVKLSEEEEIRHAETISAVLDYMSLLNEVDTTGIEPTAQVTGLTNIFRDDVVIKSSNREALLRSMPEVVEDKLKVPGVFVEE